MSIKFLNAMKRLKREGFHVRESEDSCLWIARKPGFDSEIVFMSHYGRACYFRTRNIGQLDDGMTDYFPGSYHENLTQAVRFFHRTARPSSVTGGDKPLRTDIDYSAPRPSHDGEIYF